MGKKVFIVPFFVNVGVDPRNQTGSMTVAVVIRLWHYDITWQELIINVSSLILSWSDFSCERETLVLLNLTCNAELKLTNSAGGICRGGM